MSSAVGSEVKTTARFLRQQGYSFSEIANQLNISKSTASYWLKGVKLGKMAQDKLQLKMKGGREKAQKEKRKKAVALQNQLKEMAEVTIKEINLDISTSKLLCSIFIWTEGGERSGNRLSFVNSNPVMIKTFLYLLRKSFKLDERKFRALIHVHTYHNDEDIKIFWSDLTEIPLSQFYKSYIKLNSGQNIRNGYKGCINIRYYDSKIVSELRMIYNIFAKSIFNEGV